MKYIRIILSIIIENEDKIQGIRFMLAKFNRYLYILFCIVMIISCSNANDELKENDDRKIVIAKEPSQTIFFYGESISYDGVSVELYDGTDNYLLNEDEYEFFPPNGSIVNEMGDKNVKILYKDLETSFKIQVITPISEFITNDNNYYYHLYSNQSLKLQALFDKGNKVLIDLYRRNPNEMDYSKIYSSEPVPTEYGKLLEYNFSLPNNNYTTSDYYYQANIYENDDYITSICSDKIVILQELHTEIPTLNITTNTSFNDITKDTWVSGKIYFSNENINPMDIEIKGRGNSSWNEPKKGYNFKFKEKKSVLDMPKSKKWCLISNYSDRSLLHNKYISILGNNIFTNMLWNPSFEAVDVVWNDLYLGQYLVGEKICLEDNRLNIQDISKVVENLKKNKLDSIIDINMDGEKDIKDGGFLLEIDSYMDGSFSFYTEQGVPVVLKDPDEIDSETQLYIKDIVQKAEDSLYLNSDWVNYIDIDSAIDWYIINEIAKSIDAQFATSVYIVFNPTDGKLYLGPNWDYDKAFGNATRTHCSEKYDEWYVRNIYPYLKANWVTEMFKSELFINNLKDRWNILKIELEKSVDNDIYNLANGIEQSANLNFIRWPIIGKYITTNPSTYHNNISTWNDEIDYMQTWTKKRINWLDNEINNL